MADFFEDSEKNEDDEIVVLHNEANGKDEDFYHLATIDVDKRWFAILKPVDKLEDIAEDEVLIYEIVENEAGEDIFAPIEDDRLLARVFEEFQKELEKQLVKEEKQ